MTNSEHPRSAGDRTPVPIDWEVVCVSDPAGLGADFAYTAGLARRGVPELHIWARPPDGDDPGADWKWSPRDLTAILDRLAQRLLAGDLDVGDRWSDTVDHGLSTVRFELVDVGRTPALETFRAEPGVRLSSVRWSLERELPTPDRWPVDEALRQQLELEAQRLGRAAAGRRRRWGASGVVPAEQAAGVWTQLLDHYRAAVLEGSSPAWLDVLETSWVWVDRYREVLAPIVEMARLAGRDAEVRAALAAAHTDAEQLCWTARRILREVEPGDDTSCYVMTLRPALEAWLSAAYPAVIVADLGAELPAGLIDSALGWLRSLADPEWATVRFELEVAAVGGSVDVVASMPTSSELVRLLDSLRRCSTCAIDASRSWIDGCARAAARGVGAPLALPCDMGLRLLHCTGDLLATTEEVDRVV